MTKRLDIAIKAKQKLKSIYKDQFIGIGITKYKFIDNKPNLLDEYLIVFFVKKKLTKTQLSTDKILPSSLTLDGEKIITDVREIKQPAILIHSLWDYLGYYYKDVEKKVQQECGCNQSRCRPIHPGLSVCDCELTACTLTGIFRDSQNNIYAVTNAHCTKFTAVCQDGGNIINRQIAQPGPYDGGQCPNDVIGVSVKGSDLTQNGATDTLLISLNQGITYDNTLHGLNIAFNGNYRTPDAGETTYKSSRTTGTSIGNVVTTHLDIDVQYCPNYIRHVTNTIQITNNTQPGDSGSPIVSQQGDFLGQVFAGDGTYGYAIDPNSIYQEFGIVPLGSAQPPPPSPPGGTPPLWQCLATAVAKAILTAVEEYKECRQNVNKQSKNCK